MQPAFAIGDAGKLPLLNPDEMETQIALPPGPMVPAMPPPDCLQAVMAGLLVMEPPIIDPTLQYKQNFKAMMEQRKGKQPMSVLSASSLVFAPLRCRSANQIKFASHLFIPYIYIYMNESSSTLPPRKETKTRFTLISLQPLLKSLVSRVMAQPLLRLLKIIQVLT